MSVAQAVMMSVMAGTYSKARREELASFLRSRRDRVTPAEVGLAPGVRRRTPGLRREEVAQLAGVGVTWYTWLEQGRPINASVQVLDAIARVLRLGGSERDRESVHDEPRTAQPLESSYQRQVGGAILFHRKPRQTPGVEDPDREVERRADEPERRI